MALFHGCSASCIAVQIMFEMLSLSILKKHDMLVRLEVETLDYLVIVRVAVLQIIEYIARPACRTLSCSHRDDPDVTFK